MLKISQIKFMGIMLAVVLILWAIFPLVDGIAINSEIIVTSTILLMVGVAYPVTVIKPEWLKAVLFFEGMIIALAGNFFLFIPYNYFFLALGAIIVLISILAYKEKLPNSVLRVFYR